MSIQVPTSRNSSFHIDKLPNVCPFCKHKIIPLVLFGKQVGHDAEVFFSCTNTECSKTFIGYYAGIGSSSFIYTNNTSVGNFDESTFPNIISDMSPDFCEIYNQSKHAETLHLFSICGTGYRKALEFLIKDYAIMNFPNETDIIKSDFLAQVIEKYIENTAIKSTLKMATWLGNDETHYTRKWTELDIKDLKNLIKIAVKSIEGEELQKQYVQRMMPPKEDS